jgi:uncharacterized protein YbcI
VVPTRPRNADLRPPVEDHLLNGSPNAEISRSAVQLLREYTGRGPTRARTTINGDSVMIVLGDILTKGERKLAENGKAERVLAVRHDFQLVMRDELVALVERTIDRKVIAFMSDNHLDPDLAVEVFILEPATSEPVG